MEDVVEDEIEYEINKELKKHMKTVIDNFENNKKYISEEETKKDDTKVTQEQLNKLLDQSYHFASLPLIKLIKNTINIDLIDKMFLPGKILQKTAEIEFHKPGEDKKWILYLDIVNNDYNLNFGPFENNEEAKKSLIDQCLRLVSFAQILFEQIRNKTKELLEYQLILDHNSTLYLDIKNKKRIGIRFESIKVENN